MPRIIYTCKLFCFCLIFSAETSAQLDSSIQYSLQLYAKNHQWDSINKYLYKFAKRQYNERKLTDVTCKQYLEWIHQLEKNNASRVQIRIAYMNFANVISKHKSEIASLKYLLIAHSLVDDLFCLDKYAWFVENSIANIYNMLDDLEKSQYFHGLTRNALEFSEDYKNLSRTYTNLGTLYHTSGDLHKAMIALYNGLQLANEENYYQGIFSNEIGLVESYLSLDSFKLAQKLLYDANFIIDSTPVNKQVENRYNYNKNQALLYFKLKNYEDAICYFKESFEYFSTNSGDREFAKLCKDFAKMYLVQNNFDECANYLLRGMRALIPSISNLDSLPDSNQLYQENTFTDLFEIGSDYYYSKFQQNKKSSDLKQSIAYLELAVFGYKIIRGAILTDASKLITIGSNRLLVNKAIVRLMELKSYDSLDPYYFLKIRQFFSYSKALLLDSKNNELARIYLFSDKDRSELYKLEENYYELSLQNPETEFESNFILGRQLEIKELERRIFTKYPIQTTTYNYPENYIEYLLVQDSVYILAKLNQKILFQTIGSNQQIHQLLQDINKTISQYQTALDSNSLKQGLSFLLPFDLSILPKQLCIIPDGEIQYVPFDALMLPDSSYLIEHTCISYSFQYGNLDFKNDYTNKSNSIYVLKPEYPEAEIKNILASRGQVSKLYYTNKEVAGIAKLFGEKMNLDTLITLQQLPGKMQAVEIFHFAGHAMLGNNDSYLVLDDKELRISAQQLKNFHMYFRMTVLSACETGLGTWEYGEGIRSLGKSLMEAGSESVVMSLWSVIDESTAKIMNHFYTYLFKSNNKDEALRQAKLDYINEAGFEKVHPYFWAGFVAYGNMEIIISPKSHWYFYLIGIILFILIIYLNKIKQK
ncbi:MAG: CHAT domain-containing protein [Saprospiraceae bacterium]|nr:CHAT domain-containing protein [Saprospiraceae bacterium]